MTVAKLIRRLQDLSHLYGPRTQVVVDKLSLQHPLESDGMTHIPLDGVVARVLEAMDGDGFYVYNKDGRIRLLRVVALVGDSVEEAKG